MSRYVDLNGVSWDGKPISSKIQEVQTKQGYLQGITVGWLWGDNVPHIDLEEHDKQVRADAIDDFAKAIICELKNKHTDMPIVDILGSREKWKEKNSQYLECENLAYKIAKKLKAGEKE